MSYIDKNLISGEKIVYQTGLHWSVLSRAGYPCRDHCRGRRGLLAPKRHELPLRGRSAAGGCVGHRGRGDVQTKRRRDGRDQSASDHQNRTSQPPLAGNYARESGKHRRRGTHDGTDSRIRHAHHSRHRRHAGAVQPNRASFGISTGSATASRRAASAAIISFFSFLGARAEREFLDGFASYPVRILLNPAFRVDDHHFAVRG